MTRKKHQFRHIEIEINATCDVNCPSCDRFCDVAPGPSMTLGQIRHFIAESSALDWPWERIHILGGEPTIHPQFRRIAEELLALRRDDSTLVRVISNGAGRLEKHRAWLDENGIDIAVSAKAPGNMPEYWHNMWLCAADESDGPQPVCSIFGLKGCGIGLTRHGYFLCGAGASVARVCGLDIGIQRLTDLTIGAMEAQAVKLCRLCAHKEGFTQRIADTGLVKGPFWTDALSRYQTRVPPMTLYGETE